MTGRAQDDAIAEILSRMTVREKVGQLNQRLKGWQAIERKGPGYRITDVLKREVDRWHGIGALYGLFRADPWSGVTWDTGVRRDDQPEVAGMIIDYVIANSASGLAPLLVEEAPHGHQALGARLLPPNLAQAATWDPELVARSAARVAADLRASGIHIALVSGLDMARDPRWGRSEECFGEDPTLAAAFVARTVAAMQGSNDGNVADDHVGVVLKHFIAQGAGIGGRNGSGAPIGTRELTEIHLPAAFAGIRAGAVGVMSAYNDVDGMPCTGSRELLTTLLRDRWGFTGFVMSDGGAIDRLESVTGSPTAAAALALRAGVDMSLWDESFTMLERALDDGLVTEHDIDMACARVLRVKDQFGLLDGRADVDDSEPRRARAITARVPDSDDLRLTEQSIVLLKNDRNVLPLEDATSRIAVIGPNSDDLLCLLGDYTPPIPQGVHHTILDALRSTFPEVAHERGCDLTRPIVGGTADAAAAASGADVCIAVLGDSSRRLYDGEFDDNGAASGGEADPGMTGGEGVDLADISLPEPQLKLLEAVAATGVPVITIVIAGRAHPVGRVMDLSAAVLYAAYPGPLGAEAIARTLTGANNPSGLLPVTLPAHPGALPVSHDERIETSRGYADNRDHTDVLLGSGFGYSSFDVELAAPATSAMQLAADVPLTLEVTVRNTGDRTGRIVLPLFARRRMDGIRPRKRELLAFDSVTLEPGAQRIVVLSISAGQLRGVDAGGSVRDGQLTTWVETHGVRTASHTVALRSQ